MLNANTATVEENDSSDDDDGSDTEVVDEAEESLRSGESAAEITPTEHLSQIVPVAVPVTTKPPRRKQTKRRVIRKQPITV